MTKQNEEAVKVCTSRNVVDVDGSEVGVVGKYLDDENFKVINGELLDQDSAEVKLDDLQIVKGSPKVQRGGRGAKLATKGFQDPKEALSDLQSKQATRTKSSLIDGYTVELCLSQLQVICSNISGHNVCDSSLDKYTIQRHTFLPHGPPDKLGDVGKDLQTGNKTKFQ